MPKASQLELFNSIVRHMPAEEFLYYMQFTSAVEEKLRSALNVPTSANLKEHFGMYRPVYVGIKAPSERVAPDFSRYYEEIARPANSFINELGVLEIPGSMHHFTSFVSPLRNAETLTDIEDFPFPNVKEYTSDHMCEEVRSAHSNGLVAACWAGHMYEDAWQIRGYEQFLMDMISEPAICEFILDRLFENNLARAVAGARAGVDVIMTGDDVANQKAMMFNIDLWRMLIKPRWAKIYAAARDLNPNVQIWYHSDGNIEDIIHDLIDIGITILNPVQPECLDVAKIKREYGKDLVFDGTIGTQTTMPFGTPEQVKAEIDDRKLTVGVDGALIISPTHILEPDVPTENIMAFLEAAR
jgi:uroporphyrinogen decarboxylase